MPLSLGGNILKTGRREPPGKVDMMSDGAVGRKSVIPDEAVERKSLKSDGAKGNKSMMLDGEDFNARLSDYEVENMYGTSERFGYALDQLAGIFRLPPEDGAGVKSEIYAFGVVLLEIITWMMVYDVQTPLGNKHLVEWATTLLSHVK
ncbi:hypothetical protein L1887_38814 [Cichorium endivia]|nr:hypothetical protein L1887_38814 [Cichorium endivia]